MIGSPAPQAFSPHKNTNVSKIHDAAAESNGNLDFSPPRSPYFQLPTVGVPFRAVTFDDSPERKEAFSRENAIAAL
jgi:hypothetical protein